MKKMMFLTLALSVMAMGSAMANDSMADNVRKPRVKVEVNYICDGHHHDVKHHVKHAHRAPKHGCAICNNIRKPHRAHRPHPHFVPGMRPAPSHHVKGSDCRHDDRHDGRHDNRPNGRPNGNGGRR